MIHCVQYSTGVASAEIAWRLTQQHGPASIHLHTADTSVEDPDNWRFAREVHKLLGEPEWVILRDGRDPMKVGRDNRIVPNSGKAICSKILKRELLRRYIRSRYDPAAVLIYEGYDWTEQDRITRAVPRWLPYQLRTPLADPLYTSKPDLLQAFRDRGVEPPELYSLGFPHANCGGGCVRGGQAQWELLLRTHPDRYAWWEAQEEETRALLDRNVSIMKEQVRLEKRPLPLREFRHRIESQPDLFDCSDWGACGCHE